MAFGRKKDRDEKDGRGGFFSKRNHDDDVVDEVDEPVPSSSSSRGKQRKRRKNEMLASVLKESVVDQALAELKANDRFTIERNGQTWHVGWLLDTDDIGGLSKKTNRDEDKGGIIECINSGRIKVLITAALMEQNKLVIIPDAETLDAVGEFTILTHAPYKTIFIETTGSRVTDDDYADVSYMDAQRVLRGDITLSKLLSERGSVWGEDAAPDVPSSPVYGRGTFVDDDDDDLETFDDTAVTVDASAPDLTQPLPTQPRAPQPAPNYGAFAAGEFDFDDDDIDIDETVSYQNAIQNRAQGSTFEREPAAAPAAAQPAPVPQQTEIIPPEVLEERARRKFFSDDLGLDIDYGAFDAQFDPTADFAPFPTDRPSESFIGDYLNQMSIEANADLTSMHARHMTVLRERYTRMMASYMTSVEDMHSLESGASNEYASAKASAEIVRNESLQASHEAVSSRIRELKEIYEERKQTAVEAASARAAEQYDSRHGKELDRQINNVDADMRTAAHDAYNARMREINYARKAHAAKSMDFGTTAVLAVLAKTYSQMLDAELARYEEHRQRMQDWLEENRKNDVVWSENVQEQLRQTNLADDVAADFEIRMRQQQMDFEQRRQAIEGEMEDMRTRHESAMKEAAIRQEALLNDLRTENTRLRERERELLDRYSNLDTDKDMIYSKRIKALEQELEERDRRYDELANRDKRSNILWMALAIVFAVATLCVGMLFGLRQNIDYQIGAQQASFILDMIDWSSLFG